MSKTPRTDKEAFDITTGKPDIDGVVMADFARELELELNEQVLLNGKGSEREYILLGKIERLERENAKFRNTLVNIIGILTEDNNMTQAACMEKAHDYAYNALYPKNGA